MKWRITPRSFLALRSRTPWSQDRRSFWAPPPSTTVENSGSIARDILATERTFLAWSRTGLGFVGAGSALFAAYHRQQADETTPIHENSQLLFSVVPACALLMANGAYLLVFATRRYLTVITALQRHEFPIDIRGTLTAVVLTATSTIASLGLIASAEIGQNQRTQSNDTKDE